MKTDISSNTDIQLLVDTFYDKVKIDPTIGFIFNDIIGQNWSHHLPIMYRFWNMVLFSAPGYEGNPVRKHLEVNKKIALNKQHFDRWLELWRQTVDELFTGEKADEAKKRATLMAELIRIKVEMSEGGKLIQ